MVDFSKYLKENSMSPRNKQEVLDDTADDSAVNTELEGGELLIELPADFAEQVELANKPPIEPGRYLATILNVLPKVTDKGTHASKGLMWSLVIDKNPEAVTNGWDSEDQSFPYQHYTYIGKIVDGKLTETDKGGQTRDMGSALGLTGSFGLSAVKFRQIIVIVAHKPSIDDQQALAQDPTHEIERLFIDVKYVKPYIVDGIKGPKNGLLDTGE